MGDECSCPAAGFCQRRGKHMTNLHFQKCQAGHGAALDALHADARAKKEQPVVRRSPVRQHVSRHRVKRCSTCSAPKKQSILARAAHRAASLKKAAIDFLQDGMAVATVEQQHHRSRVCAACPLNNAGWCDDTKGGCGCNLALKVIPRSSYCPLGKWSAYRDDYRPLVNPVRHLLFHIYPLRGKEWNWHWHLDQIRKHQDKFNGRIVIGVGCDSKTATIEEVQSLCRDINVDHWLRAENTKLAETLTHVEMFSQVLTHDPNAIIFRGHTKGVTHNRDSVEQRWAEIMWEANMDLASVEDALASHLTVGVMRSQTPLVKTKPGAFFYAGSFYWMRAKEVFERDWTWKENNRWITEYVPSHLFEFHESACVFHDLVPSSVLNQEYFAEHVEPEWAAWKLSRGLQ